MGVTGTYLGTRGSDGRTGGPDYFYWKSERRSRREGRRERKENSGDGGGGASGRADWN